MLLRLTMGCVVGFGATSAMMGGAFAADFKWGHLGAALDAQPYTQAFEPFSNPSFRASAPACLQAVRAAEQSSGGVFGVALAGYAFECGSPGSDAMTADGRLAQSFEVVAEAQGTNETRAPAKVVYKQLFGRPFEVLGLPSPVVASPVEADLLDEASWSSEAVVSAAVISEVLTLSTVGVAAPVSADTLPVAEQVEASVDLSIAADAEEVQKRTPPSDDRSASIEPSEPVRSVDSRPAAAARPMARKSALVAVAPRRRAVKTVSVSRTLRLPRSQADIAVKPRVARRPADAASPSAPVVASRPQARSFSPKMSSAGPAQTAPKL